MSILHPTILEAVFTAALLTAILVHRDVFGFLANIRPTRALKWLAAMTRCPLCLGFWMGLLLAFLHAPDPVTSGVGVGFYFLALMRAAIAASFLSLLTYRLIDKLA